MHGIPGIREPQGVGAGGPADVEHRGRWTRRVPFDQLPGSYLLK
jgi:hypothetical protein